MTRHLRQLAQSETSDWAEHRRYSCVRLVDKSRRFNATDSHRDHHRVASTADQYTRHVHKSEEVIAITRKAKPGWTVRSGPSG